MLKFSKKFNYFATINVQTVFMQFLVLLILALGIGFAGDGLAQAQLRSNPDDTSTLQQTSPPLQSEINQTHLSSIPGTKVVLRGLDKVTAITHDFTIKIGQTATFGSLRIEPSYCRKKPPEETPEVFAFLTITDRQTDGFGQEIQGRVIFNGWMFASSPALNALEHPVYDVWVLDCK